MGLFHTVKPSRQCECLLYGIFVLTRNSVFSNEIRLLEKHTYI